MINGDNRSFALADGLDRGRSHALHGLNHFWSPGMVVRPSGLADRMSATRRQSSEEFTLPVDAARNKAREIINPIRAKQTYSRSRELASASRRSDSVHGALPSGSGLMALK